MRSPSYIRPSVLRNKSSELRNWLWRKRMEKKYTPHAGMMGDGTRLHLLVGISGGGLNHLYRLLQQNARGFQFINQPLEHFEPHLEFAASGDRLATEYLKTLAADHPLARVLRMIVEEKSNDDPWALALALGQDEPLPYVVKEVHALLALEPLIRELQCRVLCYVSDPVILAEQLFAREGLDSPYLMLEGEAVREARFLSRFVLQEYKSVMAEFTSIARVKNRRIRQILTKILTISLVQKMFRRLAALYPEQIALVDYSLIAKNPIRLEFPLVQWLGHDALPVANTLLKSASFTPMSASRAVWKNSWPESLMEFDFLSLQEVKTGYHILSESGLAEDGPRDLRPTADYAASS